MKDEVLNTTLDSIGIPRHGGQPWQRLVRQRLRASIAEDEERKAYLLSKGWQSFPEQTKTSEQRSLDFGSVKNFLRPPGILR